MEADNRTLLFPRNTADRLPLAFDVLFPLQLFKGFGEFIF